MNLKHVDKCTYNAASRYRSLSFGFARAGILEVADRMPGCSSFAQKFLQWICSLEPADRIGFASNVYQGCPSFAQRFLQWICSLEPADRIGFATNIYQAAPASPKRLLVEDSGRGSSAEAGRNPGLVGL